MHSYLADKTIIIYNSVPYFIRFFEEKGFKVFGVYRRLPLFLKLVKFLFIRLGLPKYYWFDRWKSQLDQIDTVIFFAGNSYEPLSFIVRRNPRIRIIYYYWNPVFPLKVKPSDLQNEPFEIWTFDPDDAEIFGLKLNTTFYFDNIVLPKQETIFDVCFIGVDKGRRQTVVDLFDILKVKKLKTYSYIVDSDWNKKPLSEKVAAPNYKKPMPYNLYLEKIAQSKCILDLIQEGQSGLTLRVMESLFFHKKLITNDRTIVNYEFYHPENIFVLGIDRIDKLPDFLSSPYCTIPRTIIQNYDVSTWFSRFFRI
ncbi:MAG TPA: hypothetical protein VKZ95_06095 [Sphingobacteriaceae bacterium]|nr:hypothetical protein [Sphingobacteriaceae bacterium]